MPLSKWTKRGDNRSAYARTVSLRNADKYISYDFFLVVTNRSGLIKKMFPTAVPPRGGNGQHHGTKN